MALSAMKLKKLKAVQVGQSIELQTTDGATYKGVVTEKDEQSIEITGDGFEQVVDYMPDGGEVQGLIWSWITRRSARWRWEAPYR